MRNRNFRREKRKDALNFLQLLLVSRLGPLRGRGANQFLQLDAARLHADHVVQDVNARAAGGQQQARLWVEKNRPDWF